MQTNIKTKLISPERYLQVWKAVNKQLSKIARKQLLEWVPEHASVRWRK